MVVGENRDGWARSGRGASWVGNGPVLEQSSRSGVDLLGRCRGRCGTARGTIAHPRRFGASYVRSATVLLVRNRISAMGGRCCGTVEGTVKRKGTGWVANTEPQKLD